MLEEREVITLVLGLCAVAFFAFSWGRLKRIPHPVLLLSAFGVLMVGWVLTIVEDFVWPQALNTIEHACYAVSPWLLVVWWSRLSRAERGNGRGGNGRGANGRGGAFGGVP